jgi:glutathione S-transferase
MKLIGSTTSPYVRKVRIVLAEKKIECDFELNNPWADDTRVPDYNPLGKVPALVLEDGRCLYDSRVIVEFLDNVSPVNKLIPASNRERSEVRRWEALADGVLDAGIAARLENARPDGEKSPAWVKRQMGKIASGLAAMDRDLGDKPWCTGNDYTLADIAVGACLGWLEFRFGPMGLREEHSNLGRLLDKLAGMPSYTDTTPKE